MLPGIFRPHAPLSRHAPDAPQVRDAPDARHGPHRPNGPERHRRRRRSGGSALLLTALVPILTGASEPEAEPAAGGIVVYEARKILTMEPGQPEATAVAVRDGWILDVGSLEQLEAWLGDRPHRVDRRFARRVLMPGFIDPHLHPFLAGKLLTFDIAAPETWNLPTGRVAPVTDREAFVARVRQLSAAWDDPERPHVVWGWHRLWHGDFDRAVLDEIAPDKPLILWHRSYHEIVANSRAMALFEVRPEDLERYGDQIDLERGLFRERGMGAANQVLARITETPEKIAEGLAIFRTLVRRGGVTTVADMIAGNTIGIDVEWAASREHLAGEDVPFRTLFVAAPVGWQMELGDGVYERLEARRAEATPQLRWPRAVKTLTDGAFISQLMRLGPPGYLDGHEGEWMIPPALQRPAIERYWREGFDVYDHVNGDAGVDVALDLLATLQRAHPRDDYRFSLEHFGVSREEQIPRLARLGASVSVNGYYVHYFADRYARHGLGYARASQMTRLGSLSRAGVRFTMHSDCPMGPIEPLLAVTTAVTRRTAEGRVMAPGQAVSVEEALRAVTIDAAWNLRLDHEVGSIAPGKRADFVVLERSPYDVRPDRIRHIGILGTVYEGRFFETP
jgi:predicted amidohydrolase YtcJ